MWLLKADGSFDSAILPAEAIEMAGDTAVDDLVPDASAVVVMFGGTADGRGFSVARQLRARGYAGIMVAAGPLIPDQARHAVMPLDGKYIDLVACRLAIKRRDLSGFAAQDNTKRFEKPAGRAIKHAERSDSAPGANTDFGRGDNVSICDTESLDPMVASPEDLPSAVGKRKTLHDLGL